MTTNIRNTFGTVVHDVPAGTSPTELRQTFATVAHDVPAGTTPTELRQTFATVAQDVPQFFATASNVSALSGEALEFSASVGGQWSSLPKTDAKIGWQWELISTPSGSELGKVTPLPDNSSPSGWTDMTDNVTLFHFNEDLSWSSPSTINGITGSSTLANTAEWSTSPAFVSGSNPRIVTSSLGDIRGVELFDTKLVTTLTASQLGVDAAESRTIMLWAKINPNHTGLEYLFCYGTDSNKNMLGLMGNGDALQGNAYPLISDTGFDGYSQPTFYVTNVDQWRHYAVTYESGSTELVWYVDGEIVFVDPLIINDNPALREPLNTADGAIHIGGYIGGDGNSMSSGSISEFAIFSSSLPAAQIKNIYNKQRGTGFYQNSWNKLPDSSANVDWVDMSDNRLLYHFDDSTSGPRYQLLDDGQSGSFIDMSGSVGLWHMYELQGSPASSSYSQDFESTATGTLPAGWSTFGDSTWQVTSSDSFGGSKSVGSGDINDGQSVSLVYTASVGVASQVEFYWKVSSENGWDFLRFFIDDVQQAQTSGPSQPWVVQQFDIPSGTSVLRWTYIKDGSISDGTDNAWIDDFVIQTPANFYISGTSPNGITGSAAGTSEAPGLSLLNNVEPPTEYTGSILFNGSNSGIDFGLGAQDIGVGGSNSRTFMAWAKQTTTQGSDYRTLWSAGTNSNEQNWSLYLRNPRRVQISLWSTELFFDMPETFVDTEWNHFAATYDGTTVKLFVNGIERNSVAVTLNTANNNIKLGETANGFGSARYPGNIQEFAIFNRDLSSEEIYSIYKNQTPKTVFEDKSGNSNDIFALLDYTSSIDGPFSGSSAWSGSASGIPGVLELGDLPITGSSGLSFSTWVNPTKNLTDESFYLFDFTNGSSQDISLRKDISLTTTRYHNVIFEIGDGSVSSEAMFDQFSGSIGSTPLESGWVHWVATADGEGVMSLYKNGLLVNSASSQGAIPDAVRTSNYIGINTALATDKQYTGRISEFAMWERELTAYEVQKIYQHQYSGSSVYNNYGVDSYSNSASILPDVDGEYVVQFTAFGSTASGSASGSSGGGTTPSSSVEGMIWELISEPIGQSRVEGITWEIISEPVDKPSLTLSNVSGFVSQSVCFEAVASYTTSGSIAYVWEWISVPTDSQITSGSRSGFSGSSDPYNENPTGSIACFYPDVTGSYNVQVTVYNDTGSSGGSFVIGSAFGIIEEQECVRREGIDPLPFFGPGFVMNTYPNLSAGRERRVDQVPFKLGSKDRLGLRLNDTIANPGGIPPTYCSGNV